MLELIQTHQKIVKDMLDFPDKYPPEVEKKIIDNPYYVPRPQDPSSLSELHLSLSKSANSSRIEWRSKKNAKNAKSFWLKKCFRNPAGFEARLEASVEECEQRKWPRKKAVVTFANEVFVDDIRDLNEKSTASAVNFNFDFCDLYKFISPNRKRRSKS